MSGGATIWNAEWKNASFWLEDDNLRVLSGLALQCRTLGDLAKVLDLF